MEKRDEKPDRRSGTEELKPLELVVANCSSGDHSKRAAQAEDPANQKAKLRRRPENITSSRQKFTVVRFHTRQFRNTVR